MIKLIKGDITKIKVDAIVNAANITLLGGGGVDGAIHYAGGPKILEECIKIGHCNTGEAVITTAGYLPARYVIHTVGPVYGYFDNQEELLTSCYEKSLELAVINNCKSISFPNISTGVYGYPKNEAAKIALKTISSFLERNETIDEVIIVSFTEEDNNILIEEYDNTQK
jgi:O-acetyl-ADP-ribose deacetylase